MIDLKDLMDTRSSATPGFDHLRLALVQRRVLLRRRRRIAVTVFTAVVLLLFGGYAVSPALTAKTPLAPATASVSPSPSPPGDEDFEDGRHTLAATSAPVSAGSVELTWTPLVWAHSFDIRCSQETEPLVDLYLGTRLLTSDNMCNLSLALSRESLEPAGVILGQPVTLKAVVQDGQPARGTIRLAIRVRVPFAEYPLPPRPAQLKSLMIFESCNPAGPSAAAPGVPFLLRSDPADPAKPVSIVLTWSGYLHLIRQMTTPGMLHLDFDGVPATIHTSWDYGANLGSRKFSTAALDHHWGPRPEQGKQTTLTVTPEMVTGPWQIGILQTADSASCFVAPDGSQMIDNS